MNSESVEVQTMEEDEDGNIVRVKKTKTGIRPNDRLKAWELLNRLTGLDKQTDDNELTKVDELLNRMRVGVLDED